ncbi:MAG: single-stranded DNA-binding protein [Defluviitaleaceae bacterium]|nr:single-stranded DNA-binding protein [Defluviitaleaceae bacterium]
MNKVILMGRLARDPEIRYSSANEPLAIARYAIAVARKFKRENEPDADFINCVVFGKGAEFAEKYLRKGMMIAICGRLSVRSYDDPQTSQRKWITEVIVDEQNFAESKASFESRTNQNQQYQQNQYGGNPQNQQYQQNQYGGKPQNQQNNRQNPNPQNYQNAQNQYQAPPNPPVNNDDAFFTVAQDLDDDDLPF